MMYRFRWLIFGSIALIFFWIGLSSYRYFFDHNVPTLSIIGIDDSGSYCGDIQCRVSANKKGQLSAWLDGQPLINNYWLSLREHEHPFTIPSKTIANGKHTLRIELADSSFNKNKSVLEHNFYVDNTPLQAAFVRSDSDFRVFQGRTLHLQFQVNKEIKKAHVNALAYSYDCFPESKGSSVYECFVPISCEEAPNEYLLNVDLVDKVGNTLSLENKFQVVLFPFKKETLSVSAEKVEEERALGVDNARLEEVIEQLLHNSPCEKLWRGPFCLPIDPARITCEFGTIRTTQEKGRYAHKGLDLANMPRSVVWADQDGIVVHKERYAFTGNTVIVDHGWGVLSLFFHLDNFANIQVGQKISKGNPIGTVGKTGYATGFHLHWEMRLKNNVQVDPVQWTKASF